MGAEQIYNPLSGVNRMITDIENAINPVLFKLHPLLQLMGNINLWLVSGVLLLLFIYLYFIRKHRFRRKLENPKNYILIGIVLIVYAIFAENPVRIGSNISFNLSIVALPIISKILGPLIACIFGFLQYLTSFLLHQGEAFSITSMFLAGISGIIYAMFIYDRKTKFLRCFWAKFAVNIVCNILLVPMAVGDSMTQELADSITSRIISNLFLAPFQAVAIFFALLIVRKIRNFIKYM